jgi:hypothetical protein
MAQEARHTLEQREDVALSQDNRQDGVPTVPSGPAAEGILLRCSWSGVLYVDRGKCAATSSPNMTLVGLGTRAYTGRPVKDHATERVHQLCFVMINKPCVRSREDQHGRGAAAGVRKNAHHVTCRTP